MTSPDAVLANGVVLFGSNKMASEAIRYQPRYSAEDYRSWEGEWELWDGVAVNMSPSPTFDHQSLATNLSSEIRNQLKSNNDCNCMVVTELDWQLGADTVVRPDVSVLCKGHPGQFISYAPTVIAEVLSRSTEHKDRTAKRQPYQQQGVQHYLMLDPVKKTVEILSLGPDGEYQQLPEVTERIELTWGQHCRINIPFDSIFAA